MISRNLALPRSARRSGKEVASSQSGRPWSARGRIGRGTRLRIVDAILTGVHQPGESHFELMKAFANDDRLARIGAAAEERGYRSHEFGDSLLIDRGEEEA
jgi:S-adenosylmethionine:tRNA-ribosyltransferase-isomerase (queuine synthetase)